MMNPKKVHDKLEALEARMRQLSSTNKQLIEALMDSKKAIESLTNDALGIAETGDGTRWYVRDELLSQIKTALRDDNESTQSV